MKKAVIFFILTVSILFCSCFNEKSCVKSNLDDQIGQMLMVGFRGTEFGLNSWVVEAIREENTGGVVLFDYDIQTGRYKRNIESKDQLKKLTFKLQKFAGGNLFIAVDQEGGEVVRLKPEYGFGETVSAERLGEINDPEFTYEKAFELAGELRECGINMNLAPVVDLNVNPESPAIGKLERSFSADPDKAAVHSGEFIKACHKNKVLCVLKHYPGHGSAKADSHKGFTDVTDTWSKEELVPYRRLTDKGLADAVMTAHVFNGRVDENYPSTLSKETIDILRDEMGFEGVIISDDMQMGAIRENYTLNEAVIRAVNADVDMLLFGNNLVYEKDIVRKVKSIIRQAVTEGKISVEEINDSVERIQRLKRKL